MGYVKAVKSISVVVIGYQGGNREMQILRERKPRLYGKRGVQRNNGDDRSSEGIALHGVRRVFVQSHLHRQTRQYCCQGGVVMSIGRCGCGKVVYHNNDGKDDEWAGLCENCVKSDGNYQKSPNWRETVTEKRASEERKKHLTGLR